MPSTVANAPGGRETSTKVGQLAHPDKDLYVEVATTVTLEELALHVQSSSSWLPGQGDCWFCDQLMSAGGG